MLMDQCVMQAGKNVRYLGITILILNQICMRLLALDKSALLCNFVFRKTMAYIFITINTLSFLTQGLVLGRFSFGLGKFFGANKLFALQQNPLK